MLGLGIPGGLFVTQEFRQWRIDLAEISPVYEAEPPHPFLAVLVLCGVNGVFFRLLERPTEAGQELLSHVEGFKHFLTATDEDPLERLSTKEAQELYERVLPYAVALGMKNRWATTSEAR